MVEIALIILTCNKKALILSCLNSLKKVNKKNIKLTTIVVDNGSKDETVETIIKKYPEVIVIDNKINYGFAKGINCGLRFAYQQDCQYILLLNNDIIPDKDFLIKLISQAKRNSYYICGPKILTKDNKIWSIGGVIDKVRFSGGLIGYGQEESLNFKNQKVDFISGTAMLVKREVFEKIGFFDEDYFFYYEDLDFCFRAGKAGFKSYLVPSSEIIHLESKTIKKNSPSHYYHAAKSHLIFVFKRAPLKIKIREFLRLGKTTTELIFGKNLMKRKYELLAIKDFFLLKLKFGQNTTVKEQV